METISLDRLQIVMDNLSADINRDIRALQGDLEKNQGALLGLATLIQRINAELLGAAESSVPVAEEILEAEAEVVEILESSSEPDSTTK